MSPSRALTERDAALAEVERLRAVVAAVQAQTINETLDAVNRKVDSCCEDDKLKSVRRLREELLAAVPTEPTGGQEL